MVNASRLPLPKLMRAVKESSKRNLVGADEESTARESNASTLSAAASAVAAAVEEVKPKKNLFSKLLHKQPKVGKKTRYLFPSDVENQGVIDEIIQDKGIVNLEIEGLIVDQNCRSLANNLRHVLTASEGREWQSISFFDTFAPEEFISWRGHKHAVMSTLALTEDHHVQFRANIEFPPGTSIKAFMDTLRNVHQHNLVQTVEFYGVLYNTQKNTIIHALEENVDREGSLMNTVRLEVVCGLTESNTKFELVEMCLQKSRDMVAKAMTDSSSKKSQSARTEPDSEFDPDSSADIGKISRRARHGTETEDSSKQRRIRHGRRPTVATSSRRTSRATPESAQAVSLPVSDIKPRRTTRRERRQTVKQSPISVAEIYGAKDTSAKDLGEMFNSSLPSLLSMPGDEENPVDELEKFHLSSSEFSATSECSEASSSSRAQSARSRKPVDKDRRRARRSRRTSDEATRKRRSVSRSGTKRLSGHLAKQVETKAK